MFRNTVADELILATPCVLAPGVLPKKIDKDPAFRANAIFTREELEQLVSDPRILEDRRILHALKGLAALRHTEAATLRWDQYDTARQPLGCLSLEKTKTKIPRQIAVHPALARLLADWQAASWERTYGRPPTPTDLIVPTRNDTSRAKAEAQQVAG
jgi:integrase